MKAALIPPVGYERTALESDIHLVLPLKPLVSNTRYVATYQDAQARGDYVILDNGCAEGQLVDGDILIDFARKIRAHEIVAPDVMGDAAETLFATSQFLAQHKKEVQDFNVMAVLQGRFMQQRLELLHRFNEMDEITTVGIPKACITEPGSTARLDTVTMVMNEYPNRFKIHLLGLHPKFPTEMLNLEYPEEVRSMDSTQPYKITETNRVMSSNHAWASRRDDYFTVVQPIHPPLLASNIKTFLKWARSNEG